jgi:hypothetical protein
VLRDRKHERRPPDRGDGTSLAGRPVEIPPRNRVLRADCRRSDLCERASCLAGRRPLLAARRREGIHPERRITRCQPDSVQLIRPCTT